MQKAEAKSGNSSPENMYANTRNVKVQKTNNPRAEAIKITQDRLTLALIIFLILMFLILVIFISLAFIYSDKITEEVSHLMNGEMEKLGKEVNELKNKEIESLKNEVNGLKSKVNQCSSLLEQHTNATRPSCESGWLEFEGHCYFFSDFTLNWTEAEKTCLNRESHLVIITSQVVQNFLMQHYNEKKYWIGLTDLETEGTFRWVDGTELSPSSYKYWKDKEPNNGAGKEDCAHLFDKAQWNDVDCSERLNAICEKRLV